MLTNAALLRIDPSLPATSGGAPQWSTGDAITPPLRCMIAADASADDYAAAAPPAGGSGRLSEQRSATLRVSSLDLARADLAIGVESRVLVQLDRQTEQVLYRVRSADVRPFGSLSFVECKLVRD